MFCQKCGKEIPDNGTFCSSCGAPVPGTGAGLAAAAAAGPSPASVAADKVKAASKDAFQAFLKFIANPIGGLSAAYEDLGPGRAFSAGVAFGVVFALCLVFWIYRSLGEYSRPTGPMGFIKIVLVSVVPFVTLAGASFLVRLFFRGAGALGSDSFVSGAALLPFGIALFLSSLLGIANFDVSVMLLLFANCLTVLMLFAGLTRISKLSDRSASLAVPVMLLLSAWLSKVIYRAMLEHSGS